MNNYSKFKTKRIIITGGGSGGHTFPLIAVLRELKKITQEQNINLEVLYCGAEDFTLQYILKEGIKVKIIKVGKLRRYCSIQNFIDFFKIIFGLVQSFWHIFIFMPDLIFSKGGYVSFPVVFWGIIFLIPVIIHESDSVPGFINEMFGKKATKTFISFEKSKKYFNPSKTILTGNPIRQDILLEANAEMIKKNLGLTDLNRPIVVIMGGSQGSQQINDLVLDCLPQLINKIEIIHQTGLLNYEQVKKESEIIFQEIIKDKSLKNHYHLIPFFEETNVPSFNSLKDMYLIGDLIIARAGSGQIFEIAAFGKPSILIPLPWASRDHQKHNAYEYSKNGSAIVLEKENLQPNTFSNLILSLSLNKNKLSQMSQAAKAFSKIDSAKIIANEILKSLYYPPRS